MKLKINKKTDNRIEFNLEGIDSCMANALRRIIISEIPIMAVEEVTFYDNSSVIHDELLAHRMGLVPLKTDPAGPDSIKISLDVKGPKTVYAGDLKLAQIKAKGADKKTDDIVVYDKMLLVKLTENQKIKLEATAKLGKGKEHMKWQGALASYEQVDDEKFVFFVESYGQMKIEDLIKKSLNIFKEKIEGFKSGIK